MEHETGTYLALGVTSKKLGLYISRKVKTYLERSGVLVAKIDPYKLLESLIPPDLEGFTIWGCTRSGVLFSPARDGFYLIGDDSCRKWPVIKPVDKRQFEGVKFKSLGLASREWESIFSPKTPGTTTFKKDGKDYTLSYLPLVPDVLYVLSIVSEDFMLPSLAMLQRALKLSNGALLSALLPLIAGLFILKRQHDDLSRERIEKNISEYIDELGYKKLHEIFDSIINEKHE